MPVDPSRTPRLNDADTLRGALRAIQRRTGLPVVFGGPVHGNILRLTEFLGARTTGLRNLAVRPGTGLGGRVVAMSRAARVLDYGTARTITHHYDRPVLGEGLRSIAAVPVTVAGRTRAVLYGAVRQPIGLGDAVVDTMTRVARAVAEEVRVRDEVERRLALVEANAAGRGEPAAQELLERLREVDAELRVIANAVADEDIRRRLLEASRRLTARVHSRAPAHRVRLSPRELDVLSLVALGCPYAEVARRLGLRPETVKSYMRTTMRKLDSHNRHEAVVAARRLGLLL